MAGGARLFILDANVLIDYCAADRALLRKISVYLAPISVPYPVFEEVDLLTEGMCSPLKIELVEYTSTELEAVSLRCGSLSLQDRLCFELSQLRRGTCITNDKPLRRHCNEEGVPLLWGLQPLLQLVQIRQLSVRAATKAAEKMKGENPFLTQDLLDAFLIQLDAIDKSRKSRSSR